MCHISASVSSDLKALYKSVIIIIIIKKLISIYSTMKTEDIKALGRQRAKPSKIKARYSQPTCKNCSYLCAPL